MQSSRDACRVLASYKKSCRISFYQTWVSWLRRLQLLLGNNRRDAPRTQRTARINLKRKYHARNTGIPGVIYDLVQYGFPFFMAKSHYFVHRRHFARWLRRRADQRAWLETVGKRVNSTTSIRGGLGARRDRRRDVAQTSGAVSLVPRLA